MISNHNLGTPLSLGLSASYQPESGGSKLSRPKFGRLDSKLQNRQGSSEKRTNPHHVAAENLAAKDLRKIEGSSVLRTKNVRT